MRRGSPLAFLNSPGRLVAGTISQCPRQDYAFAARARGAEVDPRLGWLASNGILGEVKAMEKGYDDEKGVEQKTTPGGPGVDGVASVAAGRAGIGQGSSNPSSMLAGSAGVPVKSDPEVEDDAVSVEPGEDEEAAITGGELPGVDELRAHFSGQRMALFTALMTLVWMVLDNNTSPCPVGR